MRDREGMPLPRGVPLSGDRLRSNPEPGSGIPPRPFSKGHWQSKLFLSAGLVAAILLANAAAQFVIGLSASEGPAPRVDYEIPAFASLVECDAHFRHEILRLGSRLPAHNSADDLPLMHRNYRRLNRLLRQVGRRDGIPSATQTELLRVRVQQLNAERGTAGAAERDRRCRAMANLPIARKRDSQLIVGR